MPRVNLYRGDAVQREGLTGARLVPADFRPSPLGEGLQQAGRALGEYAEKEDRIQSLYDEQDANRLDLEHVKQTQVLSDQLREARGAGARARADEISSELERFNTGLLERARSPRSRMLLENSVGRRTAGEVDRYQSYADQEFVQDFRATNDASITASIERANDIEDIDQSRDALESDTFRLIEQRAMFEGWEGGAQGPQATALRLRTTDNYHSNRASALARADPMAARDYALAHRTEMSAESVDRIVSGLNNEVIEQEMETIIDGIAPVAANDTEEVAAAPREETPIALPGVPSSRVGYRQDPNGRGRRFHAGEDRRMAVGTPVPSRLSGRVARAENVSGYGNLVEIDHGNGLRTRYAHLSRINVRPGQAVGRGDIIAASGGARGAAGSGNSTGPHLHHEVLRDGRPVDPSSIDRATVVPSGTRTAGVPQGDVEEQVAALRARDDLSYRQKQIGETILRRRYGQQQAALREQWEEADRRAAGQVAQLGEGFTSISQIDTTGMDPRHVLRYSNMAQANRQQTENEPPSPDLMLYVNYQRYANPSFYASEQFLQEVARRGGSSGMLRTIAGDQGQILGTRIPADRARIWSIADPILQAAGIDFDRLTPGQNDQQNAAERMEDARRRNALLANLEHLHNIWAGANPGQPPPENVVREWVSRSVMQSSAGAFSLLSEEDSSLVARLNPRDRARAEQALRSQNLPINDQTIALAVRHRLARTRRAP